jgi:riboflavin biosynthesis pyrimidine reductase
LLNDGKAPTLLIHAEPFELPDSDAEHVARAVLAADDGEIPIARILDFLGDRGIQSLLVEGGPNTWRRFLAAGLVDRAHLCQSPAELSGKGTVFSQSELIAAGLKKLREIVVSEDKISHWRREN